MTLPRKLPTPQNEWPLFGRDIMDRGHALPAVARMLEQLEMGALVPAVMRWLGNYDGLDQCIDDEYDPLISVRNVLSSFMLRRKPVRFGEISSALTQLDFLHYRACWTKKSDDSRRLWVPLEQPFLQFASEGEPDEEFDIWRSPNKWPSEAQLNNWFATSYLKYTRMGR